jgi:hypothetical protein
LCSDFICELEKRLHKHGEKIYKEWDKEKFRNKLYLYGEKIDQSHKVVVLFTKDFLDDIWNAHITCLAFMNKLERDNLIPVRLSGGGKPDYLVCISDVEFEDDGWKTDELNWGKLTKAILLPDKVIVFVYYCLVSSYAKNHTSLNP